MKSLFVPAALAIAASCSAPSTVAVAPRPTVTPPRDAAMGAEPVLLEDRPSRGVIEAPSAGQIRLLAITPDGSAALSSDELGGIRLWPALDGSREPRVVDLASPRSLAIGKRPDGFVVVEIDDVGDLVVANVDAGGRTRSRVTQAADPAFVGVAMTEVGALAWRADHTIALVAGNGTTRSTVGVEPGQQLVTVAASGRRAVALIQTSLTTRRARWVTFEPRLAWGAWIGDGGPFGEQIAVASDGSRIAVFSKTEKRSEIEVIATATGKVVREDPVAGPAELGFAGDHELAIATAAGIAWLELVAAPPAVSPSTPPSSSIRGLLAIGGGRALGASDGELVLAAPEGNRYLGYDVESPSVAAVAPNGQLIIGLADTLLALDGDLHVARAPAIAGVTGWAIAGLRWLDGDDWMIDAVDPKNNASEVSLVDAAHGTRAVVLSRTAVEPQLGYEPSTHLVTLSLDETPEVDRYDPVTHTIVRVAALPKPKIYAQSEAVPVSPALAGGTQLVRVTLADRLTLQWLKDPRALDRASASVQLLGSFAGVDAAGHVFAWAKLGPDDTLVLAVYTAGKRTATLEHDASVALWPDPTGTRVIEIGAHSVALYGVDGAHLWTVGLAFATEALWLTDGTIALITAAGIARLDPTTGAVIAARCGWGFGLSTKPHPPTPPIDPVCTR